LLALELGWSDERAESLRLAGLMHDVGKLAVPEAILLKPGPLDTAEYEVVKQHAARGAEIVSGVLSEEQVAWVRHHHERWDGTGYPAGIGGEQIPDGARLLAVADAWDVMTGARTYFPALTRGDAFEECRRWAGHQFAPEAVDALAALVREGHVDRLAAAHGQPPD